MSMRLDQAMIRAPLTWPLRIMVAAITGIATMVLTAGLLLGGGAIRLNQSLQGQITIEIPPNSDGQIDAKLATTIRKDLAGLEGVKVSALDRQQIANLLQPWLSAHHEAADIESLPLPQLLDVQVDDEKNAKSFASTFQEKYPQTTVTSHQAWLNQLSRGLRHLAIIAALAAAALLAALFSTIIFACQAGLAVQRPMIELLHMVGATGGYIARETRRYAWRLVWPGCASGVVAAALASGTMAYLAQQLTPVSWTTLVKGAWFYAIIPVAAMPLISFVFSAVSAWWATRQTLMAMP